MTTQLILNNSKGYNNDCQIVDIYYLYIKNIVLLNNNVVDIQLLGAVNRIKNKS